jgi:hypothetical protein
VKNDEHQKFLRHYFHHFVIPKNASSSMMPKKASSGTGETAKTTVNKNHFHEMLRLVPQAREIPPQSRCQCPIAHLQMLQNFWQYPFPRLANNPARQPERLK